MLACGGVAGVMGQHALVYHCIKILFSLRVQKSLTSMRISASCRCVNAVAAMTHHVQGVQYRRQHLVLKVALAARVVATAAWGGQSCPKWVVGYTIERSSLASVILPELPLLASLNPTELPTCFQHR